MVLEDQDVKADLLKKTPNVKQYSVESMKVSDQAISLMMVSIKKLYQTSLDRISEVTYEVLNQWCIKKRS